MDKKTYEIITSIVNVVEIVGKAVVDGVNPPNEDKIIKSIDIECDAVREILSVWVDGTEKLP